MNSKLKFLTIFICLLVLDVKAVNYPPSYNPKEHLQQSLSISERDTGVQIPDTHHHKPPYGLNPQPLVQHPSKLPESNAELVKPDYHGESARPAIYQDASTNYDVTYAVRRVEDTKVECLKDRMVVTFKFSSPFNGYIYPYNQFEKCLLFHGQREKVATMAMKHGICGDQTDVVLRGERRFFNPVIEHRLMVQWEPEFICDDDASIIVRCDRPDDYNKTVTWDFRTLDFTPTLVQSTHPGPKMWMEIQRGEGPNAPPLDDSSVFIGDVLTLVFTLSDEVFWFDSNIITCHALDGGNQKSQIEWAGHNNISAKARAYAGEMTVIENGCSTKPKIFSHFYKDRLTASGKLVTVHYAHLKAFRFPTSLKLVIQCEVQVCYRNCPELAPCSTAFQPRFLSQKERQRREAENTDQPSMSDEDKPVEVDQVQLYRTIEVLLPEDGSLKKVTQATSHHMDTSEFMKLYQNCYSPAMFYGTAIGLGCCVVLLTVILVGCMFYPSFQRKSTFTPTKN